MSNNRVKTINNNKPFYYKDIIYYIKSENIKIQKIQNPTTKNIYKEILQNGSKQYQVAGEEKTNSKPRLSKNLEKHLYILCGTILHISTF